MDGFSAIPVFVAVVESGGFSPAARSLGISKSAVSKRVNQLEQHLGVKLLHRTTRKLSLTEAGKHYFEHAAKAHNAAKDAEDAVAQLQGEPQGLLRINTPMSFGRLHIAPLIAEFLTRYPKISIDMMMDDKVNDLVAEGFDLAIRAGDLPDSSLIVRKLAPLNSVLCASPAYLKLHGTPTQIEQLSQHNCLQFSYSQDVKEWTFMRDGQSQSIEVKGNYRVNNSEALRDAMLQGLGIGRLPTFVAGPDIKAGRLVTLLDEFKMPNKTIHAVFAERQYLPAKVRAFIDFAVEYLAADQPYWELGS
ncbi:MULTISPECIES: LysR family transcriptional regulator [unclassified Agarivorans]|uniref:LysR family transcriptional regulator n=1 Tax=unclassified Agarivorans TaxID=2636026 RepID=UPI0026E2C51D|nr:MULTISPECIES: LysR family transcriptional regulator [unclassified Agarivorans]MDO6687084.1 LysR family transcriptional regulator [Agarivorans sp. 3_MG-2023]MDO6713504.1 LysR family transcriptional regulator [Agarivorans sp. 2_MG-2023]